MKNISINIDKALGVVTKEQVYAQEAKANECIATLHNGNGAGNDFLGWLHLPSSITDAELTDIENTANVLRSKCEVVVAIGIGGSYLGTKAVVEALNNSFDWLQSDRKNPVVLYAGQNIGEDYLYELCEILKGKQFGLINISKSGTTTEPALAFRMLKKQLEDYAELTYTGGLNSEEYGVGFRKGSDLAAALNEFFVTSYQDGSMLETAETYGVQAAVIEQK